MKMKLAAAAVAAALVAPMAAHADVTVYGLAQLELANVKVGTGDAKNLVEDHKNSRIGVRFSEDLGDGLKANGELEWGPAYLDGTIANGTAKDNGFYARQQWIGLSGGWGEFQIGTLLQPYKYSGGVKYDAFVATEMEARNDGGMLSSGFGQGKFFANAMAYKNKFGGVEVWLAYSPEKDADQAAAPNTTLYPGSKGDTMASVVVPFSGGEVGLAYAKDAYLTTEAAGTAGEKNTKIFGKYSFGPSTILAQYETSKTAVSANDLKDTFVAYQFKMGTNTFVAQVGSEKSDNSVTDTKYLALGMIHGFSKNTSGFIGYRNTDVKPADTATTGDTKAISAGLSIKF